MKVSFKIKISSALKKAVKEALEAILPEYDCYYGSYFSSTEDGKIFSQVTGGGSEWRLDFSPRGAIKVTYDGARSAAYQGNALGWKIKKVFNIEGEYFADYELKFSSFPINGTEYEQLKNQFKIWGEAECEFFSRAHINGKIISHQPTHIYGHAMDSIGRLNINNIWADVIQVYDYEEFQKKYANVIVGVEIVNEEMAWVAIDTDLLYLLNKF